MSLLRKLWDALWTSPNPLKMHPDEAKSVRQYYERTQRQRPPDPNEGEVSKARTCFFLKKFTGEREQYYVDTEAGEIHKLAFTANYEDHSEHFDLEIPPR